MCARTRQGRVRIDRVRGRDLLVRRPSAWTRHRSAATTPGATGRERHAESTDFPWTDTRTLCTTSRAYYTVCPQSSETKEKKKKNVPFFRVEAPAYFRGTPRTCSQRNFAIHRYMANPREILDSPCFEFIFAEHDQTGFFFFLQRTFPKID